MSRENHPAGKGITHDVINHPSHYTSDPSGVECIQITRHRNFNIGNAIKYLWRAGLKDGNSNVQDLKKAVWYLQDEIQRLHDTEQRKPDYVITGLSAEDAAAFGTALKKARK